MRNLGSRFVLTGLLLINVAAIADTDTPPTGDYTDGPGLKFFEMLRLGGTFDYAPTTFEATVERSSVIATGYLVDVIPGRMLNISGDSTLPSLSTVFLKISPTKLLKGVRDDYYLVEIPAPQEMVDALRDELYTGSLLFLLQPEGNDPVAVSPEAQAEGFRGKSLYVLTMQSTLFAISGSGNLTSPIDRFGAFRDLYTGMRSLEELEAHILAVQGGQLIGEDQAGGEPRQWYMASGEDDALQGVVQEHYESGQLRSEINYYNGEREGPARYWYESGAPQAEGYFSNGKVEGRSRYWFENGQLSMEATFHDGQRIECRAWTQDGVPAECP